MICFRDTTFCDAIDCANTECHRRFSEDERRASIEWWDGCQGDPPVAFSPFRDTEHCQGYIDGGKDDGE